MPLALVIQALIAIFIIAIGIPPAAAQPVRAVPALSAHVVDETGTLSTAQQQALEAQLVAIEQRNGSQVVVLMVPSTAPEDIAAFANRVGNAWKIGRKDVGDGVLVLVAKDDRRMRIEVAKALEGAIPDIAAARIIDGAMKPRFRDGDFAGGIEAAVQQIGTRIAGENKLPCSKSAPASPAKTCRSPRPRPRDAARSSRATWAGRIWPSSCSSVSWSQARCCAGCWGNAWAAW